MARVRRSGAKGELTLRADSGFFSWKLIETLEEKRVRYSITVRQNTAVTRAIAAIPEDAWVPIDYTVGGEAEVAETTYASDRRGEGHEVRLVVRRTRLTGAQATLWPDWRHHAFVTDRAGDAVTLDADHRRHAVVELAIRDWKEGSGANHCPSGRFAANAAWLVFAALAHNLLRWMAALGLDCDGPVVAKTLRRRLITLPGRMTRRSRRRQLHLPGDGRGGSSSSRPPFGCAPSLASADDTRHSTIPDEIGRAREESESPPHPGLPSVPWTTGSRHDTSSHRTMQSS